MKNQDMLDKYIELCKNEKTINEITEILGVTRRTITNYKKTTNVSPKSDKRKPKLDVDFFKKIDAEEKAYILGFIFADGYIESNNRTLTININKKDIAFLERVKKEMKCENEIRKSSTKGCVRLHLSSIELVNDVSKFGIVKNKTFSLKLPELQSELHRHFLRGYFDGDGYIGKHQCVLVVGSESFLTELTDYIKNKFGQEVYTQKMGNYYRMVFGRKNHEIIKWMYEGNNISLERKNNSYLENWHGYTERVRSRG